MQVRSAELYLAAAVNRSAVARLYKACVLASLGSYSAERTTHHSASLCEQEPQSELQKSMKRRRLLLSMPLLPTIVETLEDAPAHPSSSQSAQSPQSLEDYMNSIQALARPAEAPSCGPVRLQRSPRLRQLSMAQMKHTASASLPRGSPRAVRTSRLPGLSLNGSEEFSLKTLGTERDCRGKDPVDWLFGQIRT